ncbi:MAG: hypothetical protein JXR78_04945 [Victivallales bacterium]|nr:hypothetical protein [Victivallales bacterium]
MDNPTDKCLIISEVKNAVPTIFRRTLPVLMVLTALYLTFAAFSGARSVLSYGKHVYDDLSLTIWTLILLGQVFMLLPMVIRISSNSRDLQLIVNADNIKTARTQLKIMTLLTLPSFVPGLFLFALLAMDTPPGHTLKAWWDPLFICGMIVGVLCLAIIWIRNRLLSLCLEPIETAHWLLMLAPGVLIIHLLSLAAIYFSAVSKPAPGALLIQLITLLHIIVPAVVLYLFAGMHCEGRGQSLSPNTRFALGDGIGCYPFSLFTWVYAFVLFAGPIVLIMATVIMSTLGMFWPIFDIFVKMGG